MKRKVKAFIVKGLELNDYYIFEIDKNPVACVALHLYPEFKKGELALPFYVSSSHRNRGASRQKTISIRPENSKARELGIQRIAHTLDAGVHLFSIKGGIQRGNAGRFAARAPRKVRTKRKEFQGPGKKIGEGRLIRWFRAFVSICCWRVRGISLRPPNTNPVKMVQQGNQFLAYDFAHHANLYPSSLHWR